MGKFKRAYRCGSHFRQIRESVNMSRSYIGEVLFPFATKKSQYNIINQIETDKRGLTIEQASAFDNITGFDMVEKINSGHFEMFNRA